MKKILALILCLLVSFSAAAYAEAAYTYSEYAYDESMFAEIGGEWIAMEGLGLMFYLPDVYLAAELPEELAAIGVIAAFTTEDSSSTFTISYGPALNVENNAAASIEELAAYYAAVGATNVDIIIVNGIPMIISMMPADDTANYSVFFEDGTQCVLTFTPASDANTALLAGLMSTSLMIAE
ncbi:MAG: hypothetical protein E7335_10975 [Clostridiales bacterium]|nr:hypothetical protein [Clostridiales bacterium]